MENELIISLDRIANSLKKLEVSTKSLGGLTKELTLLSESCVLLSNSSSSLDSNNIESFLKPFNTISTSINNVAKFKETITAFGDTLEMLGGWGSTIINFFGGTELAATAATFATTAFSTALNFLSAHPLLAAVGAIGAIVGALAIFSTSESDAEKETRLFTEAHEAKRKELVETSKAINESTASSVSMAKDAEVQSGILKGFVDILKALADENGYVKNFEEAQYYVDKINSSMPGTVELTKDGKLNWLENADAIDKNIQQLERKAKVEAYYDGYVESLKNETKLRGELTLAQNNYNTELEKQKDLQEKYDALQEKSKTQLLSQEEIDNMQYYHEQLDISNEKMSSYSEVLNGARGAYEANVKGANLYNEAVAGLSGGIEESALLMADEYLVLEEDGRSTWDSLAAATEDCKTRVTTAQGEELAAVQLTSALIQAEMVNKALSQGLTYDEMIKQLNEKGVVLNADEEKLLKASYEQWKMSKEEIRSVEAAGLDTLKLMKTTALSEMNENDKNKLIDNVKLFAENGDKSGLELCSKLSQSLEANNGKITDETKSILNEIETRAKNANPKTQVTVNKPTDKNMADVNAKIDEVPKNKETECKVTAKADKKSFSLFGISLPWFAKGGFPDTGELFIAREAGPELVGRINGKTAVANNDQIVAGISNGVYNAMKNIMQTNGNSNSMNLNATFVMDGEVIGKQVIKYHNGVVRRTGKTPLIV